MKARLKAIAVITFMNCMKFMNFVVTARVLWSLQRTLSTACGCGGMLSTAKAATLSVLEPPKYGSRNVSEAMFTSSNSVTLTGGTVGYVVPIPPSIKLKPGQHGQNP
jgi:hypothetical protein